MTMLQFPHSWLKCYFSLIKKITSNTNPDNVIHRLNERNVLMLEVAVAKEQTD